jgi:hypothetical protein
MGAFKSKDMGFTSDPRINTENQLKEQRGISVLSLDDLLEPHGMCLMQVEFRVGKLNQMMLNKESQI